MSRSPLSRALQACALTLALLAPASWAAPLPVDDPLRSDQVDDPGELEDATLQLEEAFDAGLSTPEAVAAYVEAELDEAWEWDDDAPNLVVVRNAGSGYRPSPGEAAYDDLFLVVSRSAVHQFSHGNAEGTEHATYVKKYGYDRYVDPNLGKAMTPALAPGRFRFLVGKHQDKYKALRLTTMDYQRDGLPSQRRNGKRGVFAVGAVNVHKGGESWNWSVGCLTLHYARYQAFIDLFPMGAWGHVYVVGDWDGGRARPGQLATARTRTRLALFAALEARTGLW